MWSREIQKRTKRNDAMRIYGRMRTIIMLFDMIKMHCACDALHLIEFTHVIGQIRIVINSTLIAFEMANINRVKADKRCK